MKLNPAVMMVLLMLFCLERRDGKMWLFDLLEVGTLWKALVPMFVMTGQLNDHFVMSMWYSPLCLLIAIQAVIQICDIGGHNDLPKKKALKRKRRKKNKRRGNKHMGRFRRRHLPYHLVIRCYARVGNRPRRIFGQSRAE